MRCSKRTTISTSLAYAIVRGRAIENGAAALLEQKLAAERSLWQWVRAILRSAYAPLPGGTMTKVTRIISAIEQGDPHAAEKLLPLVYAELRKLAARKLAHEKPGQTLDATALVHEAYLRLVASREHERPEDQARWQGRGHFYAAAAEAMRRILIDNARRKKRD